MGYYVNITDTNIVIPVNRLDDAYAALCALNDDNTIKGGFRGDWLGNETPTGANERVWFSWMPWNYPSLYTSAEEILEQLGFDLGTTDDGSIELYGYDNKIGDEQVFLSALAPLLASSDDREPQVVWHGEDARVWRQIVIDGEMVAQVGRLTFEPA